MTRVIGIDCGMDGFVVALSDAGEVRAIETPTLPKGKSGRQYADRDMVAAMQDLCGDGPVDLVVLEKQQAMPGQGVSSMFSVGLGFGLWRGIVTAMELPVLIVHPRTWQAVMLRDIPGDDTKSRSIVACQRLYPTLDLRRTDRCRKPDHNKADAVLLARYGLGWGVTSDSRLVSARVED